MTAGNLLRHLFYKLHVVKATLNEKRHTSLQLQTLNDMGSDPPPVHNIVLRRQIF